ncbi:MAG: hypothetical protein S4CHLAM45_13570 [Chlamydiales bacterium]|nr:hypothetical protein [Chlamydiales bacterium]MCH9620461.1 hypothetical protein [Chlamydiales bacterium]MCH9623447.1 hypothetical protein [Chlamydiales bacterium]
MNSNPLHGRCPDPIVFNDPFYRTALITTVVLTIVSALLVAFYFPFSSAGSWALTGVCIVSFASVATLMIQGCRKRELPLPSREKTPSPLPSEEKTPSPLLSREETPLPLPQPLRFDARRAASAPPILSPRARPPSSHRASGQVSDSPYPSWTPPPPPPDETQEERALSFSVTSSPSPTWSLADDTATEVPGGGGLLASLAGAVVNAASWLFSGGTLQKRLYYHLLTTLIESFDETCCQTAPLEEKIQALKHFLKSEFDFDFENPKEGVEISLQKAFAHLFSVQNRETDFAQARYGFFTEIDNAYNTDKGHALLRYIGFCLFTKVDLNNYADDAVHEALRSGGREVTAVCAGDNLHKLFKEDHTAIAQANSDLKGGSGFANANKAKGHFNVNFQPLRENNFASRLWKQGDTTVLRFGTPTIELNGNGVVVEPLFLLFLDYLKEHNLTLVSFQLQNSKDKQGASGDEHQRLEKILELGRSEEYRDVIKVIAFPMDDDFFFQKNGWADKENAEIFIGEFRDRILGEDPDSHFSTPGADQYDVASLLKQVHSAFFDSTETLNHDERQVFQMITYVFLKEYFTHKYQADFSHTQCKDAMDRAMSLNALYYYINLIRTGEHEDSEKLREFRTNVHFAPLLIKGVPMHGKRFELFMKVMAHLEKMKKDQKLANIQRFVVPSAEGRPVTPRPTCTEGRPNQTVQSLPSEAKTLDEYKELFALDVATKHSCRISAVERAYGVIDERYRNGALGISIEFDSSNPNLFMIGSGKVDFQVNTTLETRGGEGGVLMTWERVEVEGLR